MNAHADIVDLTQPIIDGMAVYPGDPGVRLSPALDLARDGAKVTRIEFGTHTGTHVDAPAHMIPGGRSMDEVRPDELMGEALVLRAPLPSSAREIERALPRAVPHIVLIDTGWCRYFGEAGAAAHPSLTPELVRALLARGMRVLGVDTMSPDPFEGPMTVHSLVLGADGLIVENLTGLSRLPDRTRVIISPIAVSGGDGAPVRAYGFVGDGVHGCLRSHEQS